MVRDLSVSQISMLTAWELNAGVSGAHEPNTPGQLCCLIKRRNQGKTDGRKLLESEQMDCSWGGMAPMAPVAFDGSDGHDGSRGSDGVDGCDGVVVPSGAGIKVAQVVGLPGD